MSSARWATVAALVAVLVLLSGWWAGSPVSQSGVFAADPVAAGGRPDALSSTWYCPASEVPGDEPTTAVLRIASPSGNEAAARISAFGREGFIDAVTVQVPAAEPLAFDVAEQFEVSGAAVLVESADGEIVVEHRLTAGQATDQVPCATSASTEWYFPSQDTLRGNSATLVLFNPFSSDAGVDITVAVDDGVLVPGQWQGIVVPAGTVRTVDLGAEGEDEFGVQRRGQFALSVQTRTGRVVAETVQTLDRPADEVTDTQASSGLRLQMGVRTPAADWVLATGSVDQGALEQLVVYNPGDDAADVAVLVTPYGGAEQPPEPFQFEVPARRYSVIDISSETRIPADAFHAFRIETEPSTPVVVGRLATLVGAPGEGSTGDEGAEDDESGAAATRPALARGTAIGTGSPVAAQWWIATGLANAGGVRPTVFVHNPSESIVVVSAVVVGGDADGTTLVEATEVAAGDSLAVAIDEELGIGPFNVVVESSGPVVVERTIGFLERGDLASGLAIPMRPDGSALVPLEAV